ncbi:PaaI family thioesterase [Peptoniphilus sp. KCTC 25270]|uniref:PaaI family thioesterase n=1 Tax=Peptoniphilus sp. KCTC 25270 TaxID=2897414 RepID=UPI001E43E904|nr:PaaI family thioesterase [Peptoniphilus sp. KCTC 25270]MCD1147553.1 PaaI family thioesterase [Peptoniphilus sp. KCTC 25270]
MDINEQFMNELRKRGYYHEFPLFFTKFDKEVGISEAYLDIEDKALNMYDYGHGAVVYGFADTFGGLLATAMGPFLTSTSSFSYLRPVVKGRIHGLAKVVKKGEMLMTIDVEVFQEEKLCAKGLFTMARAKIEGHE